MKFYDDDLQSLQQKLSRKKHLQALLKELHTQRIELEAKVASLKKIMEEDEYDVTRLERHGLASLFYGIVGKKEEKLNEERREAVTSKAKYDVAMQEQVNIDGFLRFADYFFDGLFADWAVLDKIKESKSEVKNVINQIQAVLNKLAAMLDAAEKDQRTVRAMLDELVTNA